MFNFIIKKSKYLKYLIIIIYWTLERICENIFINNLNSSKNIKFIFAGNCISNRKKLVY